MPTSLTPAEVGSARGGATSSSVRELVWFVAIAFALSWTWWFYLIASGSIVHEGSGWPTHMAGLLGPALAAFIVTGFSSGRAGVRSLLARTVRWKVGWIWYALVAATVLIALVPLVTGTAPSWREFSMSGAPASWVAIVLYLVVDGLGEEIGWRGFLADRLLRQTSLAKSALIIWPIWALWHLPLFWVLANFRGFGVGATIGWVVGIGFGSVFLTWMYRSSRCSILIVALWHTAYNFATGTRASGGLAAALATMLVVVASVLVLRRRSTWRAPSLGSHEFL